MAAGLGFKTFTTGEVLTAADTNGYLMQGVLVFASAAARDAAITSPQEGQCCYLKDTDAVLTYSGAAWVGFDDSNAIQNSIVDAKGDLVAASGADTPARLAVGNNGETLVADSSATTGLRYQSNWAAGKNKFINGDFGVNQRNFSSTTTDGDYTFDRWKCALASGTVTWSAQTFTPGTAPVAGYEGKNFIRSVVSGQTTSGQFAFISQRIEDVRTFAGQTVTVSFWAKAASGTPGIGITYAQNFGSGGSPSAAVETSPGIISAITTSWARYSLTFAMPSISGKTIGTTANSSYVGIWLSTSAGSTYASLMGAIGLQNNTIDIWGVQIEAANTATAFQTATGTLQGELAACQRYCQVFNATNWRGFTGQAISTSRVFAPITLPVQMRTSPTVTFSAAGDFVNNDATGNGRTVTTATTEQSRAANIMLDMTASSAGLVAGNAVNVTNANANAVITISAEL